MSLEILLSEPRLTLSIFAGFATANLGFFLVIIKVTIPHIKKYVRQVVSENVVEIIDDRTSHFADTITKNYKKDIVNNMHDVKDIINSIKHDLHDQIIDHEKETNNKINNLQLELKEELSNLKISNARVEEQTKGLNDKIDYISSMIRDMAKK